MPLPGTANNPDGINSFSGPGGEREPAYGAIERAKQLTKMAPVASPGAAAPQRAKRRAMRGGSGGGTGPAAAPSQPLPGADAHVQTAQQQEQFWMTLLHDPQASPLTRQYAEQALGYSA